MTSLAPATVMTTHAIADFSLSPLSLSSPATVMKTHAIANSSLTSRARLHDGLVLGALNVWHLIVLVLSFIVDSRHSVSVVGI